MRLETLAARGSRVTPRAVRAALGAVGALIERPEWRAGHSIDLEGLPDGAAELIRALTRETGRLGTGRVAPGGGALPEPVARLLAALQAVAETHPRAFDATARKPALSFVSDAAGLLLLVGVLRRLDWFKALTRFDDRVFSFIVAGTALALCERLEDPAAALLAGVPRDFDGAAMTRFCATEDPAHYAAMLAVPVLAGASWSQFFGAASLLLLRSFGERVRGFRKASPDTVRKGFLLRRGRIQVDDRNVSVRLESHALNVALHLSGMDDPVENVEWLDGRRIDFLLEGL